uniref:Uncharacterized protein n=1 Tax=Tanacetum cinerariifolium TaxID=118510 RepID=A0A699L212_TANCI|nr:hypothetical protein [Tanacetum cinerariifolium]
MTTIAAGKAVVTAVIATVAWEDGGTRLNGWRGWRSAAEIRRKNAAAARRKMERVGVDFELVYCFVGNYEKE